MYRILGYFQHIPVEVQVMGVKLAGGAEGENAVNAVVRQVINQPPVSLFVKLAVCCDRGHNRHHNAMGFECHQKRSFPLNF